MTETHLKHPEGCRCGPCENTRYLNKYAESKRDERKEDPDTGVLKGMPPSYNSKTDELPAFNAHTTDEKGSWVQPYKNDDGEPLSYQDFVKQSKPKYKRPRVRLFKFINLVPTVRKDKYAGGRHEYDFPIEEAGETGILRTAAGGLLAQIKEEIKNYGESGDMFSRTQVLIREGDGRTTTYWLRGYDKVNDAFDVYNKATLYLKGREGQP